MASRKSKGTAETRKRTVLCGFFFPPSHTEVFISATINGLFCGVYSAEVSISLFHQRSHSHDLLGMKAMIYRIMGVGLEGRDLFKTKNIVPRMPPYMKHMHAYTY